MEKSLTNLAPRTIALGDKANLAGSCVVYVMSRDQRVNDNHALLAAQQRALELELPLAVLFVLYAVNATRAREHYNFMLSGLRQVEADLKRHNIPFIMLIGDPIERLSGAFHHFNPAAVYMDFNPLFGANNLQHKLAEKYSVFCVDTHNIVPVWCASGKQEYAARTIRPKIHKLLGLYMQEPEDIINHPYSWPSKQLFTLKELDPRIELALADIKFNGTKISFKSGELAANSHLYEFITKGLKGYATYRNDPSKNTTSGLSPYLHFGQISSLRVVLKLQEAVMANSNLQNDIDALIEEIVVRKELSDNYCYYNHNYLSISGAPVWARATLAKHATDLREFIYTLKQLETAQTHDPAWNAAQHQLTTTGLMHGYMRMYWAKKVLEWSETAEEAVSKLTYLNDFYSLDGGDPNGYVGILWSVAGLHDRPWGERPIYGTVRSMVYAGLKRKFDIQNYIDYNK